MSESDKINSFEWLSVWNLSPLAAALVVFLVGFVSVNLLMIPEGDLDRGRWLNFLTNNGILIPLYVAMVTVVLRKSGAYDGFGSEAWWHWACLVVPVVAWVAIDHPNYETGQLISPSKVAHTLSVIPIGYWLLAPAPALFASFKPVGAAIGAVLAALGALWFWGGPQAGDIKYFTSSRADPHVERIDGEFKPVFKEYWKRETQEP